MASYESLPPECLLRVLAFLSLHDVSMLLQTSKRWNLLICENETPIYSKLAFNHGFIQQPWTPLKVACSGWVSNAFENATSWKQYCRIQLSTTRRWEGRQKPFVDKSLFGRNQSFRPHRFKIDVDKRLLVMTGENLTPGLFVHCLHNPCSEPVFGIGSLKGYAHVEMCNGFVAFTCEDLTTLEVWRWAVDQVNDPVDCSPTPRQTHSYKVAMEVYQYPTLYPSRGVLVPIGTVGNPGTLRALRLVYPTLCVGSQEGEHLWLWDIRTLQLIQTIDMSAHNTSRTGIRYVDVNETHAFAATDGFLVYSRTTGQCVFRLAGEDIQRFCSTVHPLGALIRDPNNCFRRRLLPRYGLPLEQSFLDQGTNSPAAIHVSPDGLDFVAITLSGYVLHVSMFDTVHRSREMRTEPEISATKVTHNASHLAYNGSHIVLAGTEGVLMMTLRSDQYQGFDIIDHDLRPFPAQYANMITSHNTIRMDASCLQLTREGIWVAWDTNDGLTQREVPLRRIQWKTIGVIDFTRPDPPASFRSSTTRSRRLSL